MIGLTGEVLEPGMPGYDAARKPAMARFHHIRPRAVVRCASTEDVVRTLDIARREGIHVVPRGGGHCFAGRSSTEGIVLDLSPLRSVSVSAGVATIGAGATLSDVYDELAPHGLTLPAGCGATVGIAGLTLGGGLGILGRRYGLTCDRLRAARVVLADGRVVDCAADREPELFWALRGAGGGQFGVVTSLVFDPVPAPDATRFELIWPRADAAAVVAAWQEWAPDAPDGLSANLKITATEVVAFGAMLGTESAVPLPPPATERMARMPYGELKRSLATLGSAEPAEPGPVVSKSEFFRRPLPARAIASLLASSGEDVELNFTPMGGAYNRVPARESAFVHRTERFLLEHAGLDAARVRRSWATVHPWGSGRVYPNFPDPDLTDWARAYHGDNHSRLARVKHAYDPRRLFRFPQSL
ncbi:MAG: FAD-binding protein [Actinophytocola sp.]|uniref:FAD-binding oxidoreductase n=1 Tax=Actinophytocola sp. TaxID=1872138 RepID=UPI00132A0DDF|nr:FAD-binding oxidoreductase [Actinophytocola sp.]MPZ82620.1 FAD-binding protein [Actinophytocola sp.]